MTEAGEKGTEGSNTVSKIGTPEYYFPFVDSLSKRMNWEPNSTQMVWHYTSGSGLIGIVESGKIFATQVSCLNDATEIRYSAKRLREAFSAMVPTMDEAAPETKFVKRYIELLQDDDATPNSAALPYFVTCFSALEDDLSQWRSYGGGENGYAIGVVVKDLFGTTNSLVGQVNYDADIHSTLAREAAEATIKFYKEGLSEGIEKWDEVFLWAWDCALTNLAPLAKDPGFSVEKEVRVIHQLQNFEMPQLVVRQRKTMMSRHLPMRFHSVGQTARFPISKVIVGPCRHREITRISVDTLLRTHGYSGVPVVPSQRPYQEM
jgi:Protein of unknown function (DUF2971)